MLSRSASHFFDYSVIWIKSISNERFFIYLSKLLLKVLSSSIVFCLFLHTVQLEWVDVPMAHEIAT